MSSPLIIGISGKKQSGKDTCASFLEKTLFDLYAFSVRRFGFADYLKEICMNLFDLTVYQCYGTNEDKNSLTCVKWRDFPVPSSKKKSKDERHPSGFMTAREVLQWVGTEIIRSMKDTAWSDYLLRKAIPNSEVDIALLVDLRFPSEWKAINDVGGKTVRLTRHIDLNDRAESEIALDSDKFDYSKFDAIIDNANFSIEETNDHLWSCVYQWIERRFFVNSY